MSKIEDSSRTDHLKWRKDTEQVGEQLHAFGDDIQQIE